jgi:hypothetical protein
MRRGKIMNKKPKGKSIGQLSQSRVMWAFNPTSQVRKNAKNYDRKKNKKIDY